jgi:hypothetical protein
MLESGQLGGCGQNACGKLGGQAMAAAVTHCHVSICCTL